MKKTALVSLLLVVAVSAYGYATREHEQKAGEKPPAKQVEKFTEEQKKLLELHNKERTTRGYVALEMDEELCAYAQKHAQFMADKNRMVHSSMSDLSKVKKSGSVGENVAWGQENAEAAVSAWMWSPGHRWNILGTSYKRAGFGAVKDKNGRYYWCTVFSN